MKYRLFSLFILAVCGQLFFSKATFGQIKYHEQNDNYMIFEARLKRTLLSDGLKVYLEKDRYYLPLSEMVSLFEFPIDVKASKGIAEGWFLSPTRRFKMDLSENYIHVDGQSTTLKPDQFMWYSDEVYFDSELFAKWFPMKIKVDKFASRLNVDSLEPLPVEQRLAREAKQKMIREKDFKQEVYSDDYIENTDLFTVPFADISLGYHHLDMVNRTEDTHNYSFYGRSIFAGFDTDFNVYGSSVNDYADVRFRMSRYSPDNQVLGVLNSIEFGDIHSFDTPLISNSLAGRGVNLSTFDERNGTYRKQVTLSGTLPSGWEVEVYRNNALIGFQGDVDNGLYEFLDLPLQLGLNTFKLIFYGPYGQKREEEKVYYVKANAVKPGQVAMKLNVQEDNTYVVQTNDQLKKSGERAVFLSEVGLFENLSLVLSVISADKYSDYAIEQEKEVAMAGFKFGAGSWAAKLYSGYGTETGANSFYASFEKNLSGLNLFAEYNLFNELKTEKSYFSGKYVDTLFEGRVSSGLALPFIGWIPILIQYREGTTLLGEVDKDLLTRLSFNFFGYLNLMYEDDYEVDYDGDQKHLGKVLLSTRYGKFGMRGEMQYDLFNKELYRSVLNFNYRVGRSLYSEIEWQHEYDSVLNSVEVKRYKFTLNKDFSFGAIGFYISNDTLDTTSLGLNYSLGILNNPDTGDAYADPDVSSYSSAVSTNVFLDENMDGRYQMNEPLLEDVGVQLSTSSKVLSTDSHGNVYHRQVSPYQKINVRLKDDTLPDITLYSGREYQTVLTRPGSSVSVYYPVIKTGMLDGYMFMRNGSRRRAVKGIRLQMVNQRGDVIASSLTDVEGYYVFDQFPLGRYTLRIDPTQLSLLKIQQIKRHLIFREDHEIQTLSTLFIGNTPVFDGYVDGFVNVDKDGKTTAFPFMNVYLKTGGRIIKSVQTDLNGYYRFDGVGIGRYEIVLKDQDVARSGYVLPKHTRYTEITKYELSRRVDTFNLRQKGLIDGRVVWNLPNYEFLLEGLEVRLMQDGKLYQKQFTDTEGHYFFKNVPYGRYEVVLDYNQLEQNGYAVHHQTQRVELSKLSASASVPDLSMQKKGVVDGVLQFELAGKKVPQSNIKLSLKDSSTGKIIDTIRTNVKGEYSFEDVPLGSYQLVFDDDQLAGYRLRKPSDSIYTEIKPLYSAARISNIVLKSVGSVSGELYAYNRGYRRSLSGVRVYLKKGGRVVEESKANQDGIYQFQNVPTGRYQLDFDPKYLKHYGYDQPKIPVWIEVNRQLDSVVVSPIEFQKH